MAGEESEARGRRENVVTAAEVAIRPRSSSTKARRRRESTDKDDESSVSTHSSRRSSSAGPLKGSRRGSSRSVKPASTKSLRKSLSADDSTLGDMPLADADDTTSRSTRSLSKGNSKRNRSKTKGTAKSRDSSTKSSSSAKASDLGLEGGYGSDGVLEDAKKRARERRKKSELRPSKSAGKTPKLRSEPSLTIEALVSPRKKKSTLSKISKMFGLGGNATSSLGALSDDESVAKSGQSVVSVRSTSSNLSFRKKKKGRVRSSSAGPLSRRQTGTEDEPPVQFVNQTKEELARKNEKLQEQLSREQVRTKRLRKKLQELRKEILRAEAEETSAAEGVAKASSTAAASSESSANQGDVDNAPASGSDHMEQEKRDLKIQLQQKDQEIEEFKKLLEGKHGLEDVPVSPGGSNDAIWHRLQVLLNETRLELNEKEEALRAKTASLELQTSRVQELEQELEVRKNKGTDKLKEDLEKLQEDKKKLEDTLTSERKETEDRIQKRDEALVYFRNELFKLKQESQRNLLMNSQHSVPNTAPSTPVYGKPKIAVPSSSSSVRSTFSGITSLVSPSLWTKEKVSTIPPTKSMEWD